MSLSLLIIHGMAREISERVSYLHHACPQQCQPAKRVALRCFAELVLGTIDKLINMKLKDGSSLYECSDTEKQFVKRLKLIRSDIHSQLESVGCDIGEDE
ncbi:hypothetical protein M4A21_000947 [Escherichia coli]|nr:hypothetical protein [Escherichia coli]